MRRAHVENTNGYTLIVNAPLESNILDYSGYNNNFTAQSSGNTFDDNSLYITGTNRGVTLTTVDISSIYDKFIIEFDCKWETARNSGLIMVCGAWPNDGKNFGIIRSSTDYGPWGLYQRNTGESKILLGTWPTDEWLHVKLYCIDGLLGSNITKISDQSIISSVSMASSNQASDLTRDIIRLGGNFSYSQYFVGWIKHFKLYAYFG